MGLEEEEWQVVAGEITSRREMRGSSCESLVLLPPSWTWTGWAPPGLGCEAEGESPQGAEKQGGLIFLQSQLCKPYITAT